MKMLFVLIAIVLINYSGVSQEIPWGFISSFARIEKSQEISFIQVVNSKGKLMTKNEALNYVYDGDTSRLFCIYTEFNMETERVISTSKELTLPRKYFYLEYDNFYLIANSSFICQKGNVLTQVLLTLHVISKNFELTSSLVVYDGNEYDDKLQGIMNAVSGKIFITGFEKGVGRYAKLIEVDEKSLKFKVIEEKNNVEISSENWKYEIEQLGWIDEFQSN